MKAVDLRTKTDDELLSELALNKKAQYNLRFQKASGQLENTAEVGKVRHNIARIQTVLTERKAGAVVPVAVKAAPKSAKVDRKADKKPAVKAKTAKAAKPASADKKTTKKEAK